MMSSDDRPHADATLKSQASEASEEASEYAEEKFEQETDHRADSSDAEEAAYESEFVHEEEEAGRPAEEADAEPFVEEEVESVLEHMRTTPTLSLVSHPSLLNATPSAFSASSAARPPAAVVAAALPRATTSSSRPSSSLPSLLPSIGAGSSSLTAAGRAHFEQASLFAGGRKTATHTKPPPAAQAATAAANVSTAAAAFPSSTEPTAISPAALAAYAASNVICSSESLGIHAITVPSVDVGVAPTAAATTPNYIHLDHGRLRLWAGSLGPSAGATANDLIGSTTINHNAPGGVNLSASSTHMFLRAAVVPADAAAELDCSTLADDSTLHLFIEPLPAAHQLVDEDGTAAPATLPACYGVKRLGCYRLRLLGQETSMPSQPDSFERFVARAHAANDDTASPLAKEVARAFDVQPVVSLIVAVEKLTPIDDDPATAAAAAATATNLLPPSISQALPLLPLDTSRTFWLSTHQHSGASSLTFVSPTDPTNDTLEITLEVAPLSTNLLDEVDVPQPDLAADLNDDDDDNGGEGDGMTHTREEGRDKRRERRKKEKKKQAKAKKKQASMAAAVEPDIVQVKIAHSQPGSGEDLVCIDVTAAVPAAIVAAAVSPPVPSLVDLLATLAISPSTSLPSSLLPAHHTMSDLARFAGGLVSLQAAGAAVESVPSSSTALAVSAFHRRTAWPFKVELTAMRLAEDVEGHASWDQLDRVHNAPLPTATATGRKKKKLVASSSSVHQSKLVGDHEITVLRTVGLLCSYASPRDGSQLNQPTLVNQTPFASFHVQMRIQRLDAEEAAVREMDAMLG